MTTSIYSILVIDDEFGTREGDYRRTFEPMFELTFIKNIRKLDQELEKRYDAFILDIVLEPYWEGVSSDELVKSQLLGKGPIVLISGQWNSKNSENTATFVSSLRDSAIGNPQVVGLLNWQDVISKEFGSKVARKNLKNVLDNWYQREENLAPSVEYISILHISDSQVGDPSWAKNSFSMHENINNLLNKNNSLADIVVFSGDIVYSGEPEQFKKAETFVQDIVQHSIPKNIEDRWRERLLAVPGNHDLDMALLGSDSIEYSFDEAEKEADIPLSISNPLAENSLIEDEYGHHCHTTRQELCLSFFNKFLSNVTSRGDTFDSNGGYISKYLHWNIDIVLLSTVSMTTIKSPNRVAVCERSMREISDKIRSSNQSGEGKPYRIVVTHHPPPSILHAEPGEEARWDTESWDSVRAWLGNLKPNLWLAGHTHYAAVHYATDRHLNQIPVVVAPSLSLDQSARAESASRGFAVVKLRRSDNKIVGATVDCFKVGPEEDESPERTELN